VMLLTPVARWMRRVFGAYVPLDERAWFDRIRMGNTSGVYVNEHSALQIAAVWACVRIIADSLSMLPIQIVERRGQERRSSDNMQGVGWLLNYSPDGEMTAMDLRSTMAAHYLLWGNAYAEIERDMAGRPSALHLITPERVTAKRNESGRLYYEVRQEGNDTVQIEPRNMFHWRGMSWDGVAAYSVVAQARQSFGLTAAMEQFGASYFGNGTHPIGLLKFPGAVKEDQINTLREQWADRYAGSKNAHKPAILPNGAEWQRISVQMDEAQFSTSRQMQVLEVARWFRVPPHKLAELNRATHANIEQENLSFVTDTLLPHACRFECEANIKLFGRNQQARMVVKHNFAALLRGDLKSRNEAYKIARDGGWLNVNEIRELEERNGIGEAGDVYTVPANMMEIDRLLEPPAPPPEPIAPEPAPDEERIAQARATIRAIKRSA